MITTNSLNNLKNYKKNNTDNQNIKNYIAYIRVSTKRQGEKRNGLEGQKEIIKYFVKKNPNKKIIKWYEEVESAKSFDNRPILKKAIIECKKKNCHLIVAKVDRLTRNLYDAWTIDNELNGNIEYCDVVIEDKSVRKMLLGFFFSIAERERELISIRTKLGLKKAREKGTITGSITKEKISKNPKLKWKLNEWMGLARKKKLNNWLEKMEKAKYYLENNANKPLKQIAEELNKLDIQHPNKKKWNFRYVSYCIKKLNIKRAKRVNYKGDKNE